MKSADQAAEPQHIGAIADALIAGSLPGELDGFGPAERINAARFALQALEKRPERGASTAIDTLQAGDGRRQMRLCVVHPDMPFLVDSVAAIIAAGFESVELTI